MDPYTPNRYRALEDYREALRGFTAQRLALRNSRKFGIGLVSRAFSLLVPTPQWMRQGWISGHFDIALHSAGYIS